MLSQATKTIVQRYIEDFWNGNKPETVDEIVADDYIDHRPVGDTVGQAALKQYSAAFHTAFPDLRFTVDSEIGAEGDVAVRWTFTGTHSAELMGIPTTGKPVKLAGTTILHLDQGKIKETWVYWDRLTLMQQLGVIPSR